MPEVVMPRLSDTMEEGELARWLKKEGDEVHKGDVIAEIETDKATMDLEAFDEGILEKHLVAEGDLVPIGQAVAVIGDGSNRGNDDATPDAAGTATSEPGPDDEVPAKDEKAAAESEEAPVEDEEAPVEAAEDKAPATPAPDAPPASDASGAESPPKNVSQPDVSPQTDRKVDTETSDRPRADHASAAELRISPLARRIAHEHDIDVASLTGTGPSGRIVRADVEDAVAAAASKGAAEKKAAPAEEAKEQDRPTNAAASETDADVEEVPLNNIRRVTARRLTESQAVPHFFLTSVIEAERLLAFRAEINVRLESAGIKVSVNDLIVRACAVALRAHPEVNASWGNDKILRHRRINVGVAVSVESGLIVPVVADADRKSLGEIATETRALAERARAGKLKPQEFTGGTFTISNLGMFGIDQFTAVINPPEAAILAVGAAKDEPIIRDGQLVSIPKMTITLTVDHRVLDGASGAAFMRDLKAILEEPLRIVV